MICMPRQSREDLNRYIESLPDPAAAQVFLESLNSQHPKEAQHLRRLRVQLARVLTLASYSPYLAESLLKYPENIDWLERESERFLAESKTQEQLAEDLARFSARNTTEDEQTTLALFKRRELLRIYLRDCIGAAPLSELTEELSLLADTILSHALTMALREMTRRYGMPLTRDSGGRVLNSGCAIVSLGKLGCRELNYSSDIDLLFLYSGSGETSGGPVGVDDETGPPNEGIIENREFFTKVAERVVGQAGGSNARTGESPIYRIDLRLRPYGRDGDLVWEVNRAAEYYRTKAHTWERQALIRARLSAGDEEVVEQFLKGIRDAVFKPHSLQNSLADIKRAKEKIDREVAKRSGGFNVKLGHGGIREIEFIAQALQLAHGGKEPWLRSAQMLIVLARLAEKGYISETERTRLSAAYTFFRLVEHRLQMESGAQTHTLPIDAGRLTTIARKCGFTGGDDVSAAFLKEIAVHSSAVRTIYNNVFNRILQPTHIQTGNAGVGPSSMDDEIRRLLDRATDLVMRLMIDTKDEPDQNESLEVAVKREMASGIYFLANPVRSLRNISAWVESLETWGSNERADISYFVKPIEPPALKNILSGLLTVFASQYLANILISRPLLARTIGASPCVWNLRDRQTYTRELNAVVSKECTVTGKTDALRRTWYDQIVGIGFRDVSRVQPEIETGQAHIARSPYPLSEEEIYQLRRLRANNLEQTYLAEAVLQLGTEIALESLGIAPRHLQALHFSIMALGRLGHAGMDYGSDVDLLVVYDDSLGWPLVDLMEKDVLDVISKYESPAQFYSKLTARIVQALSSITREGVLYRIDLRLRPDGNNGLLAQGAQSLINYLKGRAVAWEHSAYLKVREVVGGLEFGATVRRKICEAIFQTSSDNTNLRRELLSIRSKLESEKGRNNASNFKWGRGGLTDVYFITRYLQLLHKVDFPTEMGTAALITQLAEIRSIDRDSAQSLFRGYSFLRQIDHWVRLLFDRPGPVLPSSQAGLAELSRALGFSSVDEFEGQYTRVTTEIRSVFMNVLG